MTDQTSANAGPLVRDCRRCGMRTANDLCTWCAEEEAEAGRQRAELPPSLTAPSFTAGSQTPQDARTSAKSAEDWRSDRRLPGSHRRRRAATEPATRQTVDAAPGSDRRAFLARPRRWVAPAALTVGMLAVLALANRSGPADPQVVDQARKPPPTVLTFPSILAVAPTVPPSPSPASPLSGTGSPPSSFEMPEPASAEPHRAVTVTQPGNQQGTVGTAYSLRLLTNNAASGATYTFRASGLPAGLTLDPGTGVISGTATAAGTFTVRVTVTDETGALGAVLFTWSVAPQPTCQNPGQLIVDPGFESQSSAWDASDNVIVKYTGVSPHSGSWYGWFGGLGSAHTDTVSQQITLPSGCGRYSLSFWMDVDTEEQGTTARDTMRVEILDSGGSVLSTLVQYSNVDDSNGYRLKTLDLSRFSGQSVQIKLTCVEDSSRMTSFLVDDVHLDVS